MDENDNIPEDNTPETPEEHFPDGIDNIQYGTVAPDDLEKDHYYAVTGCNCGCKKPIPISGHAFKCTAVNRPFIVAEMVEDPSQPQTFDTRLLSFMRVSDDYVEAQRPKVQPNEPHPMEIIAHMMGGRGRRGG